MYMNDQSLRPGKAKQLHVHVHVYIPWFQAIVLEQQNEDGTWPRSTTETRYTSSHSTRSQDSITGSSTRWVWPGVWLVMLSFSTCILYFFILAIYISRSFPHLPSFPFFLLLLLLLPSPSPSLSLSASLPPVLATLPLPLPPLTEGLALIGVVVATTTRSQPPQDSVDSPTLVSNL